MSLRLWELCCLGKLLLLSHCKLIRGKGARLRVIYRPPHESSTLPRVLSTAGVCKEVKHIFSGCWAPHGLSLVTDSTLMDRISRCGLGERSSQYGVLKLFYFLQANDVFLLASSDQDFQYTLGQFAVECEVVGMTVSTTESESSQAKGLERSEEMDRLIGAASAIMQVLYRTIVVER